MLGYWLICAHLVGDYILQSDWMATQKTKSPWPCAAHALCYTIPFAFVMPTWQPLLFVAATHFIIDHWRLARYVCWGKNILGPKSFMYTWEGNEATGFRPETPSFMAVWLMIITDNAMHMLCNGLAAVLWVL